MLSGVQGDLTETPKNVVVLRGQDAVLNCSTTTSATGQNPISWTYDHNVISHPPCTSSSAGFIASPNDSLTDCNIRALGSSEQGISGVYRCSDTRTHAVATVIELGKRVITSTITLYTLNHRTRIRDFRF